MKKDIAPKVKDEIQLNRLHTDTQFQKEIIRQLMAINTLLREKK